MSEDIRETGIWQDNCELPRALQATLDEAEGFEEVARLLTRPGVRRIVASGNGASYYVAHALWLAALESDRYPVEVVAVPGGLIAKGRFRWREGDVLLAISSSGEFRDVIEAIESESFPHPFAAVTANAGSTIGTAAGARAVVKIARQRAVTHTQAFCGAVAVSLAIWAEISNDDALRRVLAGAAEAAEESRTATEAWFDESFDELATPDAVVTFGTGPAWAAALEAALLVKEIARIPCEGVETREGATATMTALLADHLVLSLPTREDPLIEEAENVCRALGAPVARAPGGTGADPRLAPVTAFSAPLALSVELALRRGWNPDNPEWIETYYTTARRPS